MEKKKSRYFLCVTHTQGMVMMSIYISSSPHLLLHNHTSVTMVGRTRCFERALQIGPGNLSLWPTLACFDLQRQLRAQPLFVDSSLAASTHCVAAAQVLWCTAGLFRPYMTTRPTTPPPSPDLRVLAAAVCSFYCLEIGFFRTALIGCRGGLSVRDSSLFCTTTCTETRASW